MNRKILWDDHARDLFEQAVAFIERRSPKNAEKVAKDILTRID